MRTRQACAAAVLAARALLPACTFLAGLSLTIRALDGPPSRWSVSAGCAAAWLFALFWTRERDTACLYREGLRVAEQELAEARARELPHRVRRLSLPPVTGRDGEVLTDVHSPQVAGHEGGHLPDWPWHTPN